MHSRATNQNSVPLPPPITLNQLFEFNSSQIVLTHQEAWCVLAYFFDHPGVRPADLKENDLSFAQALILEAIEQSYGANFIRSNYPTYLSKEIQKVVVSVLTKTGGRWNWTASVEALLKRPQLNSQVKELLTANYIYNWIARVKTGIRAYTGVAAP
jgi:hypothetical protein